MKLDTYMTLLRADIEKFFRAELPAADVRVVFPGEDAAVIEDDDDDDGIAVVADGRHFYYNATDDEEELVWHENYFEKFPKTGKEKTLYHYLSPEVVEGARDLEYDE